MPREFEVRESIELAATPDQVWAAIATGPGIDSWFMGRNEVQAGVGGRTRMELAGHAEEGTVTAWEPGSRFAYRGDEGPDGQFMAFEYLVEGRDQGSTVLRFAHSGFLGDDWEAEYDALAKGDLMYLRKLAVYLRHFPDRAATHNMFLIGPRIADEARVWAAFRGAFGLTSGIEGEAATVSVAGLPRACGEAEIVSEPSFLGVRTGEGLYLLVHGYQDVVVAEYHHYATEPVDWPDFEAAWQTWLDRLPGKGLEVTG